MSGLIERIARVDHPLLGPLRLNSAWPRSVQRLVLEYRANDGACVAAQWDNDQGSLCEVQRVIEDQCDGGDRCDLITLNGESILLQPYGLDEQLHWLASIAASNGSTLLSHRAGRRAVVQQRRPDGGLEYAKVLRSKKIAAITSRHQIAEDLLTLFRTPSVRSIGDQFSTVVLSSVPGVPLDECDMPHFIRAMPAVGHALREMHDVRIGEPPTELGVYDPLHECDVLQGWCDHASHFVPGTIPDIESQLPAVLNELRHLPKVTNSLIHRDMHEKQILLDGEDVGVIDLDTLCFGDPMLDLGNFVAHIELRWRNREWPKDARSSCIRALECGYGDFDRSAFDTWTTAARLRLVCVHAFRPQFAQQGPCKFDITF